MRLHCGFMFSFQLCLEVVAFNNKINIPCYLFCLNSGYTSRAIALLKEFSSLRGTKCLKVLCYHGKIKCSSKMSLL